METIGCHDCDHQVSFSAVTCPHCGSREPSGGYQLSFKQARRLGAEERNDNRMLAFMFAFAAVGEAYGAWSGSSWVGSLFWATAYGVIGAASGPPAAFVVNIIWALRP